MGIKIKLELVIQTQSDITRTLMILQITQNLLWLKWNPCLQSSLPSSHSSLSGSLHDARELTNWKKGPLGIFWQVVLLLPTSEALSLRWHFQVTSVHCLCASITNSSSLVPKHMHFLETETVCYRRSCCHAGLELCQLRAWRKFEHMKMAWISQSGI